MSQRIQITTSDDVVLSANWVAATTTLGAVILVHMYPSTKESWMPFQDILAKRGLASLAFDLRGHGESTRTASGQMIDYRKFTDDESVSSMEDIRAAYEWTVKRGIERDRIGVAGASFGANIALRYLAENPQIPAALLLSPGLAYHGIGVEEVLDLVNPHQAVQMIASKGDDDESVKAADMILKKLAVEIKGVRTLSDAGHGLRMFEGDAALMGESADWLRDRIQSAE
jgi:alpha-beta hydrolase superfamily lysophospholipase